METEEEFSEEEEEDISDICSEIRDNLFDYISVFSYHLAEYLDLNTLEEFIIKLNNNSECKK